MSTLAMFPSDLIAAADSTDAQNTPRDLCIELGWFDLDVASNPRSNLQARSSYQLERGQDGLALPWVGSVWCNGPYSNPLPWCERLACHQAPWAALWKLDSTTAWFSVLVRAADAWAPFRKRLTFERAGNSGTADFSSVLAWGNGWTPSASVLQRLWTPRQENQMSPQVQP